jgi:tetratricopeptide (TPR) repeat protein
MARTSLLCRKTRILIALALFYANSPALTGGQTAPRIQSQLESLASSAQGAQARHDYASAARCYEQMLRLGPDIPEIRANLGLMEHLLGKYDQAIRNFQTALNEKPYLLTPNFFLGVDLLKQRHPRQALPYLEKAIQLDPRNLQARLNLGKAYFDLGDLDAANQNYDFVAARDQQDADAQYGLGMTYMELQESAAEKLADVGRSSVYNRILLAESLAEEGWAEDSIRIYRSLLSFHPAFTGLHTGMGFAYVRLGGLVQARTEFSAELRAHPAFLPACLGIARIDLEQDNTERTDAMLQQVWQTDPDYLEANASLLWFSDSSRKTALIERELQDIAKRESNPALRELLENASGTSEQPSAGTMNVAGPGAGAHESLESVGDLAASPTGPRRLFANGRYTACSRQLSMREDHLDPAGLNLLAECSYLSGAYRTSFRAAETVLHEEASNPEALFWKAKSAMVLAQESLTEAGTANPKSARVHLLLAQGYLNLNRLPQAESEYLKVIAEKPDNLAADLGLGFAYWKELKPDRALPYLKRVLAANPGDTQASFMTGQILVERRQYSQARPYLLTAIKGTGRTALSAHALLGKIDAAQGNTRHAIDEINKALPLDADGSLHVQLYRLYKKLGNQRAAAAALRQSELVQRQHDLADRSLVQTSP